MATTTTPFFLMLSDQTTTTTTTTTTEEETKPEPTTKTRARKSSKAPNPKKLPQRGLGVAQLERLRLQERWKKITEIPRVQPFNHSDPQLLQHQTPLNMLTFTTDQPQYRALAPSPSSSPSPSPPPVVHGSSGFGGSFGMGGLVMNPYVGVGAPDPRVLGGTVFETSRELSSIPKLQSMPHNCDVCLKKKRFNGSSMGFNGGRDKYIETSLITGSDFLGSNMENIPNFTSNFGATAPRHASRNFDHEGVEVVAIHRKGNSRGGSVLMEYEFFPGKSGRGTSSKGLELSTEASVAVGGEASYLTTTAYNSGTSSSVDLSLKLSY